MGSSLADKLQIRAGQTLAVQNAPAGALERLGWRPVRQVALDEVWSAMRFRLADKVGR